MKSSIFSRGLELANLAMKVGLKELKSGDIKSRIEQATLIVNSLTRLKGAAMKAGQLMSLDLHDYFPPEAVEILSQLQDSALAQPFEVIEKVLKQELGEKAFRQMESISHEPIGVASIGQVHTATYQGLPVVLKVQYPGVGDSIESDLKILKVLATSFCQIKGKKMDLAPLFNEFENILKQEVDYGKEADLQKEYKRAIAKMKGIEGVTYKVPTLIHDLCTERVLVMSYERGSGLRDWIAKKHGEEKRVMLAIALLDLYFYEFFECGLVQTDANWGNFLVEEKSSTLELTALDFGATRRYTEKFISQYRELLRHASAPTSKENSELLKNFAVNWGIINRQESDAAFSAFETMIKTAVSPFFTHREGKEKFDFGDPRHLLNSNNAARALEENLVYSPPPYEIVFLHRKLAGIYSILKALNVQLDLSKYWLKLEYTETAGNAS